MARAAKGFCETMACTKYSEEYYKVGQQLWTYISSNKSQTYCPHCGYALYWTRDYRLQEKLSPLDQRKFNKRLSNKHRNYTRDL